MAAAMAVAISEVLGRVLIKSGAPGPSVDIFASSRWPFALENSFGYSPACEKPAIFCENDAGIAIFNESTPWTDTGFVAGGRRGERRGVEAVASAKVR